MTDLTSPVPDDFAAPRTGPPLAAYGVALLPLGLAGLLPLWAAALMCGLFALGVRFPVWGQARLLGTQLIIGLSVAAQVPAAFGQPRQLLVLAGTYLLLSLSGFALGAGAHALEDGRRRGLLGLLPALLAPQPGLILALAGAALARPARDARHAAHTAPGWWIRVAGGVVTAALLSALLPAPRPDIAAAFTPLTSSVRADTARQAPPPAVSAAPSTSSPSSERSWIGVQFGVGTPLLPPELALGAGLLCLLLAIGVPRLRLRAGRPPHPSELIMVAGLVLTGLLWFVSAILLNLGGREPGSAGFGAAPPPDAARMGEPVTGPAAQVINVNWLAPLAQLLALAGLLIVAGVLLISRRRAAAPVTGSPGRDDLTDAAPPAPLHRVRVAYREALAALSDAGLGRAAHETPAGYAARLGAHHPPLADPLGTLTALYEPVRYGGQLTDEQADQAEQAAHAVQQLIPTLPPADPAEDKDIP